MDALLYFFLRGLIALLQVLPLTWVARIGRGLGTAAYVAGAPYRRIALENLTMCFGSEKSPAEIRALARENFRRIGENYCCSIKTATMSFEQLRPHVEYIGIERLLPPRRVVNAGGHFGNFELYSRFKDLAPMYECAATYRALKSPALNRILLWLRNHSNCLMFERRTEGAKLRAAMSHPAILISLQIDQHGGARGLRLPFLGHDCSTNPSPAIFALRYDCELYAAVCFRTGLAKWRIELGERIPTYENGRPRAVEDLMRDVLRAQESYIRRDPANWFWGHRRWKPFRKRSKRRGRPPSDSFPYYILVRGVNWLGDAVMTTPALLRLREKFPDSYISLLTPEKLADLWKDHPVFDEIISLAPDKNLFSIARKLRAEKFDLALVLPNSPRSALEVYLAGIPRRVGYARSGRNFFLTQAVTERSGVAKMQKRSVGEIKKLITENRAARPGNHTFQKSAHQIHEYLHLTAAAVDTNPEPLPPRLFITLEEVEAAKIKFGLNQIAHPIFGLNAGAEYGPAKRWPVEKFITAAREIQQRTNCVWLLFGGTADTSLTRQIATAIHDPRFTVHNLAGKTTLRELMALLKLCRVILTNDTGPMHVATALGVPVVAPFGSTSPELTGPVFSTDLPHQILQSTAPCSPCFLRECPIDFRCMNGIGVERVVAAVLQVVN